MKNLSEGLLRAPGDKRSPVLAYFAPGIEAHLCRLAFLETLRGLHAGHLPHRSNPVADLRPGRQRLQQKLGRGVVQDAGKGAPVAVGCRLGTDCLRKRRNFFGDSRKVSGRLRSSDGLGQGVNVRVNGRTVHLHDVGHLSSPFVLLSFSQVVTATVNIQNMVRLVNKKPQKFGAWRTPNRLWSAANFLKTDVQFGSERGVRIVALQPGVIGLAVAGKELPAGKNSEGLHGVAISEFLVV